MPARFATFMGCLIITGLVALLFANAYGQLVPTNEFPYMMAMAATLFIAICALAYGDIKS